MMEALELYTNYLGRLRWPLKPILIPVVLGPLVGFLLSYTISVKYTSESLILVDRQEGSQGAVPEEIDRRIARLREGLSQERLQPMIDRVGLAAGGKKVGQVVNEIRRNAQIEPLFADLDQNETRGGTIPRHGSDLAGFYVEYTGSTPREAQHICAELTSILLQENLNSGEQPTNSLAESRPQLEEAKRNLDEQNAKLTSFRKQHVGQFSGDEVSLNTQLNVISQTISEAQQNKSYAESLLAHPQVANQKSPRDPANTATLEKQRSNLQSQLLQLQAQYTENHPDVVKTKAAIAEVEKKLAESAADETAGNPNANSNAEEAPEIHRLRLQVEHYDDVIAENMREQKRIQEQMKLYQGREVLSPSDEEQYKQLTRDYNAARNLYAQLLARNDEVKNASATDGLQQGERMRLSRPANLPDTPSFFPNRLFFAVGGQGLGLALGLGIALWIEVRHRAPGIEQHW
jgi:uncharacterized protein involved in exopolysaccharide biosynthesis